MRLLISVIVVLTGNIPLVLGERASVWGVLSLLAGFLFQYQAVASRGENRKRRLRICRDGCELLRIFQISLAGSLILVIGSAFTVLRNHHRLWLWESFDGVSGRGSGILEWNDSSVFKFGSDWN